MLFFKQLRRMCYWIIMVTSVAKSTELDVCVGVHDCRSISLLDNLQLEHFEAFDG